MQELYFDALHLTNIFVEMQSTSIFLHVFFNKDIHKSVPSFVCIYTFFKSECLASWKFFIMENHKCLKTELTVCKCQPFRFCSHDATHVFIYFFK